jgi:hypothetical protein
MNVTITTASGASYRVVDKLAQGTPEEAVLAIDALIWEGALIEVAIDFQGEAYREHRRFRGELVESIGVVA